MCSEYVGAGLPPERFWSLTPRLFLLEMQGAAERMRRERGLAWDSAMLSREGVKPPDRERFVGPPVLTQPAPKPVDWRQELAQWQGYAEGRERRGG